MADLEKVFVYMDDIIIIGDGTFEIHMKDVKEVLERLVDKGLHINPDKSSWAKDQVEYLGFLLNRDGVEPQPMKIQGIPIMANSSQWWIFIKICGRNDRQY